MTESPPIKVMIVDDHPIVRKGLKAMLLSVDDLEFVCEANSGLQALTCCQECRPDVILMDLVMPEMDGLEATHTVLNQYPDIKILILTSFPETDLVQQSDGGLAPWATCSRMCPSARWPLPFDRPMPASIRWDRKPLRP